MRTFRLILDIALIQRGPQALPASLWLTLVALAVYVVVGALAHQLIMPVATPLGPALFDLFLMVGFALALLYGFGYPERSLQTLAALGGTGTLLTLCGLPVVQMLDADAKGAIAALGVILWSALMVWSLAVTAHILRHALSVSFAVGLFLAVAYMMVSILLYGTLFGTAQ